MRNCDIAIIGAGPAGMAAAVAAYDAGVHDILLIEREETAGGILNQCIHNGFGLHRFGEELTGPEYAARYEAQVKERNIPVLCGTTVTGITPERLITAQNETGLLKIQAGAVILAMGCRERSRGALNIPGTRPAGIFSAGTAQKLMNCSGLPVGKTAVILGSGDIGLIMARRMTLEGIKVKAVCEIMPYSGGLKRNIVQCLDDYNIPLYLSTTVAEIHGTERLTGVTVAQVDENRRVIESTKRFISCDTLLLSVGLIPENELTAEAGIPMDSVTGGAVVDEYRQTQTPGIFACGNVLQVHDLVDYVSEEAALAGVGAAKFVQGHSAAGALLEVQCGKGVRYTVPRAIHRSCSEKTEIFFRVAAPMENVTVTVRDGLQVLASRKCIRVAPGEMEKIALRPEQIAVAEHLTVEVTK